MSRFFGVSLFGKVDVVPGIFYVATQFEHFFYLPLFPVESFVIIGKRKSHFRGVPIRMSGKSVLMAWLRGFAFLGFLVCTAIATTSYARAKEDWINYAIATGGCLVAFMLFMWFRPFTRARYLKALDIARRIGLDDEGMQRMDELFRRRAKASGFEIVAPPNPSLAPMRTHVDEKPPEGDGDGEGDEMDDSEPSASLVREPVYVTYVLRGRSRVDGAEVEVSVWASDEGEAKALGNHRGIDVLEVLQAKAKEPRRRKY